MKTNISIPEYDSNWIEQMEQFLIAQQKEFGGVDEWLEWIADSIVDICESWGDRSKDDRVMGMVQSITVDCGTTGTEQRMVLSKIKDAIEAWGRD